MAQDFHVSGIVSDEAGNPVQDILLILYDSSSLEIERDTTDADGAYQISVQSTSIPPTKDVEIDSGFELGAFYPNPTIGQSTLPVTIADEGNYNINMFSIDGRLLQSVQTNFPVGTHHIHVNMPVAAGMYLLQVVSSDKQEVRKVTSLSGTGVEISVTGGEINGTNHYFPPAADNTPSTGREQISDGTQKPNILIAEDGLTLVAYGGDTYQDYEVVFTEPGIFVHDITLTVDSDPSDEACSDLQLAVSFSLPTQFVTVEGMKPEFGEEPFAWLYDATIDEPGEDDRHPAFIEWIENEESEDESLINRNQRSTREKILSGEISQARVAIPLHPADYMGGGEAGIVIESEDNEIVCDPIPLTVEPLEPAPGVIELLVDELEDALISRAENLGSSPSELITAEAWNLPADLAPIAAGLQAIDGPNNPNNIRAVLSGDAPAFDDFLEGGDLELIEAVFQASGLAGSLIDVAEAIDELPTTTSIQDLFLLNNNQAGLKSTDWEEVPVDTPEELQNLMDAQSSCASVNQGTAADARLVGGLVITGAAFFVPGAQAAAGAAGLALLLTELVLSICEESLPSELSELSLEASQSIYNEDESTLGYWDASVYGFSEGYTLTWPDALGAIPGAGHVGRFAGQIARKTGEMLEFAEEIAGFLQSFVTAAWGLTDGGGPVNFPPGSFGPVTIESERDDEYFSWELITLESPIGDHPFVFDEDEENYYHPNAPGISRLRLTSEPGKFLNQTATAHADLEVRPIEIIITDRETGETPDFFVEPGESLKLEVTVSNADDASVSWDRVGDGIINIHGEDDSMVDYIAPAEARIDLLIATSEATGGARDNPNAPVRSATARVNVIDDLGLIVYPDLPCLELDDTHDFKFIYDGQEVALSDLEWDMTGPGSLGSDGSFVPVEEGEVTLEFYHPDEPDEVREISFSVREICSYLSLKSGQFEYESECVNYLIPVPGAAMGHIQNSLDNPFNIMITLVGDIVDAEPPLSTVLLLNQEAPPFWTVAQITADGMQFGWAISESVAELGIPLQIERKTRTVDGQELPAWYGTFTLPFVNVDHYNDTGIILETMVFAEFSGVLEGEHGCFTVD